MIEHDGRLVARHLLVAPGEVALIDDHYGGPRRSPARAVRPRSGTETQFLGLGPTAEVFLRAAAAAGTNKLTSELAAICELEPAWGRQALLAALQRGVEFRRFRASDVRSILEAGHTVPAIVDAGEALVLDLPLVPVRSLDAYRLEGLA
jgi:hypothetical protein